MKKNGFYYKSCNEYKYLYFIFFSDKFFKIKCKNNENENKISLFES